jgi:hypothetical protein
MNNNTKVLSAYISSILNGNAFSNWKNPPTKTERYNIAESIVNSLDINSVQKVIVESKNTEHLKQMMEEMFIGEDELKV